TYTAIRLAPLALLPFLALTLVRARSRRMLVTVLLFVLLWGAVSLPLAVYYVTHPEEVQGRTAAVSVLNPEVGGGDPVRAALRGLRATGLSIVWEGAGSGLENLPGRPLFE